MRHASGLTASRPGGGPLDLDELQRARFPLERRKGFDRGRSELCAPLRAAPGSRVHIRDRAQEEAASALSTRRIFERLERRKEISPRARALREIEDGLFLFAAAAADRSLFGAR